MTALVSNPTDHWLDLDTYTPRKALRVELWDAVDAAVESTGDTRAYWTGVVTGYQVAFGLLTRDVLDKARRTPSAYTLNPISEPSLPWHADGETYWACGVLYGYKQGSSEHPAADECLYCEQRLLPDDHQASCEHGTFCDEHLAVWHSCGDAGSCAYLDGE